MDDSQFLKRVVEIFGGLLVLAGLLMLSYWYYVSPREAAVGEGRYDFGPAPETAEDKRSVLERLEQAGPATTSSMIPEEKSAVLKNLEQSPGGQGSAQADGQSDAEKIKLLESLGR
ncbi:MAG: hypothetical protein UY83_C0010G0002 [Candidatus Adlerbacteria bacterium GW2011_GWA1_54_10]|uniref:Uncharacterized protein n=3 Tax=Candidatus Adleribacteriota TaxID=1752736 RepID=A0A1F4XZV4_9BACT|nr:MAG: hypothetical protein UY83_C0010G0002 [Candidatus Adlerbacteria bacterium GW2011_GWA1_54_10]KKW38029.1 MAG: hypothetical protein UY86_C0001G0002 [Candidatus Adlerbacteria bacterium GW2011_GWB1_54_7]OGC87056.1 MAG: hypothetical protein A3B33_00315 [Candidatus Adlerbacteria bacterium RIFCSPLOWO2_01_FULL_54_16]